MIDINDKALLPVLERIAVALEALAGGATGPVPTDRADAAVPANPWDSPGVPNGYDTVLGFFSRHRPGAFDLMEDPISGTLTDGFWCTRQAHVRGLEVVKVDAPPPLREVGIEKVNAYPLDLLAERMG